MCRKPILNGHPLHLVSLGVGVISFLTCLITGTHVLGYFWIYEVKCVTHCITCKQQSAKCAGHLRNINHTRNK